MRATITVVYVAMAVYLLLGGAGRIVIQLSAGQDLDAIPFIGGAMGLVALVLLLPAYEDRRKRHRE
ncbi:hypothetical protein [Amnibacterium sp.]|uniref:hypothetical protein n=1 Tax=Amnibacterium sp. TaxID=1872496 RepID=UPI003F7C1E11